MYIKIQMLSMIDLQERWITRNWEFCNLFPFFSNVRCSIKLIQYQVVMINKIMLLFQIGGLSGENSHTANAKDLTELQVLMGKSVP